MNDGQSAKQQIVERIKSANNILVTLNTDPSVDQLAAALGLTIMLNRLEKHATAVVSGAIPPAITFLDPQKTFENTVDSLRDFIIALDKEKADHLRYKVDGDVVKIFITPYRTTISQDDLDFSQGDYNVELVLALGVQDKEHLDKALSAHGRILHDATVATMGCDTQPSQLGSIDWTDPNSSSLSEMLVALSEALKGEKTLLDEQSATALLTGIVAATDRFSNNKTSSKVMTMAAQLMAAGANQQLIAAKLEEAHEIGPDKSDDDANNDGSTPMSEGKTSKVKKPTQEKKADDGSLAISHQPSGDVDDVAQQTAESNNIDATKKAEEDLAKQLEHVAPVGSKPSVKDLQQDLAAASADVDSAADDKKAPEDESVLPPVAANTDNGEEPSMGGTLNATTEQAHDDAEREQRDDRNKKILTHNNGDYVGDNQPTFQAPFNAVGAKEEPSSVDIFKGSKPAIDLDQPSEMKDDSKKLAPNETLEQLDKKNRNSEHADAQAAVSAAYNSAPFDPANNPTESSGAQPLGDIPRDSVIPPLSFEPAMPPAPVAYAAPEMPLSPPPLPEPVQVPQAAAPDPSQSPSNQPAPSSLPPLPDFSTLPPPPPLPPTSTFPQPQGALPPEQLGQIFGATPAPVPEQPPAPKDPNQFNIPGQS